MCLHKLAFNEYLHRDASRDGITNKRRACAAIIVAHISGNKPIVTEAHAISEAVYPVMYGSQDVGGNNRQ